MVCTQLTTFQEAAGIGLLTNHLHMFTTLLAHTSTWGIVPSYAHTPTTCMQSTEYETLQMVPNGLPKFKDINVYIFAIHECTAYIKHVGS